MTAREDCRCESSALADDGLCRNCGGVIDSMGSWFSALGGSDPAKPKLRVLDVEKMLATDPEPVPWLVEPLLARGMTTMLAGREGQGKSMLALAIGAALGHGTPFIAGLHCKQAKVLVVDAENGEREAHRRIKGLGVKPGQLVYVEADGWHLKDGLAELLGLLDEHEPNVLMLDSFRSLWPGGDENDNAQVEAAIRPLVNAVRARGIGTMLLHHAGKVGGEYRGSTAIGAAVELGFTLRRHEGDPDARTRRELVCWKSRPAPEPPPRWLALEHDGERVLLGEAEPFKAERPTPAADEVAAGILATLNGKPMSAAGIAKAIGRDKTDRTVRRVLEQLAEQGRVRRLPDGMWGGSHGSHDPRGCDYVTTPEAESDGLDDLSPEMPLGDLLADAAEAARCRCDKPLPGPDGCSKCGRVVA
jgi:hypothetical protein